MHADKVSIKGNLIAYTMLDDQFSMFDHDSKKMFENCTAIQMMIDIYTDRLEGLRTQCSTSAELIQQEIRTLEGKLIKLFSRQIVAKSKLRSESLILKLEHVPSLKQWLQVVGLSETAVQSICSSVKNMNSLREMSHDQITKVLNENNAQVEEHRRLTKAMFNLNKCIEILSNGDLSKECDIILYWDSWDCQNLLKTSKTRLRSNRSSIPSDSFSLISANYDFKDMKTISETSTKITNNNNHLNKNHNYNSDKHTEVLDELKSKWSEDDSTIPASLLKSHSHESQLTYNNHNNASYNDVQSFNNELKMCGTRLKTEPDLDTNRDVVDSNHSRVQVPKSPRTPTFPHNVDNMMAHRFTKTFKMMSTCDFCEKQMFIGTGLKCKECKYKCHKECESKVPSSCGIPQQFVEEFHKTLPESFFSNNSPKSLGSQSPKFFASLRSRKHSQQQNSSTLCLDSSSNTSSCNSSTPSSPAIVTTPKITSIQHFDFPDVNEKTQMFENYQYRNEQTNLPKLTKTCQSNDSDKTISGNSFDSQVSDSDTIVDGDKWPHQNSLSLKEWDIPFNELKLGECIGARRFATVYRGYWHGDVAIKIFNVDYLGDEKTLQNFRREVGTFRKTRHENLILFMGACMKLPHLAIVTSLDKGMPLFNHIHLQQEKFNMNKIIAIAQQISQGMGYLHSKDIIHKDLKSKNVFLENGKVVISDFGLFSVTKLCNENKLEIQDGWLCYLAPEIVQKLTVQSKRTSEFPFTKSSDVYAFGTIWYELLCGKWPFKEESSEADIWQIGKGMKQPLANLLTSRDVKDILMLCWSYNPDERPDFAHRLLEMIEKLPTT